MLKLNPRSALVLSALLALAACSAEDRATVTKVTSGVEAVAAGAPVECAIVSAIVAGSGTVCGTVAADVSAVAALIDSILKSLPPAPPAMAAPGPGYTRFTVKGVEVVLPKVVAAQVQAKLAAQ